METEEGFVLIPFEEIRLGNEIGRGTFGKVLNGLRSDGSRVAVKKMQLRDMTQRVKEEYRQLSRARHENIIALYGYSMPDNEHFCLIMEYADGGSLDNFLHNSNKIEYTLKDVVNWFLQVCKAVAFLHAMQPRPVIHRDLKPLNMLLCNNRRTLKICDFGTVRNLATLMSNNCGTSKYMPPEVFNGNSYSEKCDVFSCAITLWELLARQRPYASYRNDVVLAYKVHEGLRPEGELYINPTTEMQTVMTDSWNKSPDARPSMAELEALFTRFVIANDPTP